MKVLPCPTESYFGNAHLILVKYLLQVGKTQKMCLCIKKLSNPTFLIKKIYSKYLENLNLYIQANFNNIQAYLLK